MVGRQFKTAKCPTDELMSTNRAVVHPLDFQDQACKHIVVKAIAGQFLFTIVRTTDIQRGQLGLALLQRKWADLSLGQEITVEEFSGDQKKLYIGSMVVEADFHSKKSAVLDPFDSDAMAREFTMQFCNQIFTVNQILPFTFNQKILLIKVKEITLVPEDVMNASKGSQLPTSKYGVLFSNSVVVFEKAPESSLHLVGKSKGKTAHQSIINPEWDFAKLGVGGLDAEFNAIFRRAFASRVFPPEVVQQLGSKHVKGILLYGPPGTGKTLMARQIGKMLNAREPKIVNGPQILDKYVGESEANIRRLFADAEEEEKGVYTYSFVFLLFQLGVNSGLHIIIFDEIDAICKARGSVAGASGVHDTVVNQLLSKIDGVDQLNNILVIGMTNRRDMIDEALLRPGRLEVQMEIGLPNEQGRVQILNIHTARMREYKKLADDVNVEELAALTKNFSGAELEGLVRAAQSSALNRHVKASNKVEIDPDAAEKLLVTRGDFQYALENDVKPAFGTASELVDQFQSRGITSWCDQVAHIVENGKLLIDLIKSPEAGGLVSVLLEGAPNAGKTALAAYLAKISDFPFVKVCTPEEMVGYSESAKCLTIKKYFDDAYRSHLSCILVDNIERLLDYGPIGPRYSNLTLQALLVLLKKEPPKSRKLLIICTTSRRSVLEELEMMSAFTAVLHVPNVRCADELANVLENGEVFSKDDIKYITKEIGKRRFSVGIKKLLQISDMARKAEPRHRAKKLISLLEEQEILEIKTEES